MSNLRSAIIRLAAAREDLRPHLLPLLREGAGRVRTVGNLTADGLRFLKDVLRRYPTASIGNTPGEEALRNRGRFQIDNFQYSDTISVVFPLPAMYGPGDEELIPDLKRRGKIPDSVQTVEDLNNFQEIKANVTRNEANKTAPQWLRACGATSVKTEEENTALRGSVIFLTAHFPKEWVR